MSRMPQTPLWLKRAAWAAVALFGVIACVLVCMVEYLLEGGFPWAFLILCILQVGLSVASAFLCGRTSGRKIALTVWICAAVLSALVLVLTVFWLSFFRS